MEHLKFEYHWHAVEGSPGVAYLFPGAVTHYVTANYSLPAVYRWAILDTQGRFVAVYFGETENLTRRIGQYLNPGRKQQTNIQLKERFDDELRKGSRIELRCLAFEPFSVCGRRFSLDDFRKGYVRRVLENLALALEHDAGPQVLNKIIDASEKPTREEMRQFRELLKNMSPEENRSLLERAGIDSPTK